MFTEAPEIVKRNKRVYLIKPLALPRFINHYFFGTFYHKQACH